MYYIYECVDIEQNIKCAIILNLNILLIIVYLHKHIIHFNV